MSPTITLSADQRKALLRLYRCPSRPELAHRAHILLLLDQGYPWGTIAAVLFTSASTIARWQRRFLAGGPGAVAAPRLGVAPGLAGDWAGLVVHWVTARSPRD